ncbi:MAG: hypothetical protein ACI9EW_003378 [Cellvibrionaceae bacterium]|jgi:hypothetical protein
MKFQKYIYMGVGAVVALAIGAGAFAFTSSTQAAAGDRFNNSQVAEDGFGPSLDGGFGDMSHPGPGQGGRDGKRGGNRDNTALLEELGITQEEWDAAKEAVKASLGNLDEKPEREAVQALFADELGITTEALQTAHEAVKAAHQAEALANGDITQEQIDTMEARKAVAETIDQKALMAGILGVTTEELDTAKADGTIRDLVEASGKTREELKAAGEEAYAAAVAQAVTDGVITQEQADLIEAAGFGGKGFGGRSHGKHGNGQGGGRGGFNGNGGRGNGGNENANNNDA